jgi:ribosome-associated toxin RatA of RatAB toxin-antitoxin module
MNRTAHTLFTPLILLALLASPAAAASVKQRVAAGEIVVYTSPVKGSEAPAVVVKAVINASPRKVWEVIRKCWNYTNTMPRIAASTLVKRSGNKVYCKVTVDMPFPYSDIWSITEAVHLADHKRGRYSRTWKLQSGSYKNNAGYWRLSPYGDDPKRTYVIYRGHAVPKAYIPNWIRKKAQKSSMPKMIEKLRVLVR